MKARIGHETDAPWRQGRRRPSKGTVVVLAILFALGLFFGDPIYRITDLASALWDEAVSDPMGTMAQLPILLMLLPTLPFLLLLMITCIPLGDSPGMEYQTVYVQNTGTIPVTFILGDERMAKKTSVRASAQCGGQKAEIQPGKSASVSWGYAVRGGSSQGDHFPFYAIAVDRFDRVVFSETYSYSQLKSTDWTVTIEARKGSRPRQALVEDSLSRRPTLFEAVLSPCGG